MRIIENGGRPFFKSVFPDETIQCSTSHTIGNHDPAIEGNTIGGTISPARNVIAGGVDGIDIQGDPGAIAAFASHVGKHPQDQLASFHLKRLLNGATGTRIAMD